MKKKDILKAIGIVLGIFVVLVFDKNSLVL